MEHINVFIIVFSVLTTILVAVTIIGCCKASKKADEKAEKLMNEKEIDYSKFCDDDCIYCTAYDTCKMRDGKIREE